MSCPLDAWENRGEVGFVGVAVYADVSVTLELAEVTASSTVLNENELRELFSPSDEAEEQPEDTDAGQRLNAFILVVAFFAVASFVVFVLLSRHERDEEERRGKAAG